ncbi:predicted protein [Lichtheimia corymbifera JMRC:FSU:9682]|uniref:Uncharacterized protein n=1 Tax=Lichtheimia corymbifera JMRC:FSU:9682 TaxID=1263082 RepID=A0A068SHJ8_9FUNG|nr:predicted protein [Lichtheimia corymbifera JMRC:FSU:9682]CDH61372.1 predicted protein [Lichtheimia corymbifera JMRC:FSU:9682]
MPAAPITHINIITLRWMPPRIWFEDHDQIPSFIEFLPKAIFEERLRQLDRLVRTQCPSTHIEYYVFVFVIACVACSAGFSLAARSADISMWYPLILLLVPAALSYWTSRRRATFVHRIRQFELALKQTLREFNKTDRLKWSFRRPSAHDALPSKYKNARLCLVIQISHYAEELPSYHTAVMSSSIVLDQQTLSPPPSYSQANLQDASSLSESTATSAPTLLYTSTNSSQTSLPLSHPEPAMVRSSSSTVVPSSTWCSNSNATTTNNNAAFNNNQLHRYP